MSVAFQLNSKVRFTQERLSLLTPHDRRGLTGRIGVIQTDGNLVAKPTVYFPVDGVRQELRLFRVDPRHLELVESPPNTEDAPRLDDGKNHTDLSSTAAEAGVPAPDDGGTLSQSDLDNLFG